MKTSFSILLLFLAMLSCSAQDQSRYAVVELFTSESCLSCPSGDRNLSELSSAMQKAGQPVYCLEYHVDYWGKGDWKDPFGKNQFTIRQENYSRVLPGKEMYTPQLIINGTSELTATDFEKTRSETEKALHTSSGRMIGLRIDSVRNDSAFVHYTTPGANANQVLRLVVSENGLQSVVTSGVNKGETLHHDNLVRILFTADNPGTSGRAAIPLKGFVVNSLCELTGFLQEKKTMRITGAASIKF
jgi:hypothetical protein